MLVGGISKVIDGRNLLCLGRKSVFRPTEFDVIRPKLDIIEQAITISMTRCAAIAFNIAVNAITLEIKLYLT